CSGTTMEPCVCSTGPDWPVPGPRRQRQNPTCFSRGRIKWAVRWALMWVDMWLVVVMAGCPPQNGSEDGAPAGGLDAGEGGHGARLRRRCSRGCVGEGGNRSL